MEQDTTDSSVSPNKNPVTCCDCGSPGVYSVDVFGIRSETYRCRDCHEQACRRNVRQDLWNKYGYKYASK